MITGQNALLNQYTPTFYIKNIRDGQGLIYDSVRKAYINADIIGTEGANRLGELLDVDPSVDNPLSLQEGQALVYNSFTNLWENTFIDYNTLLNKPTSSSFSFAGLSDTAKPSLPDGYVKWNSAGTQLVYSTTIPAASITGLATVATTGDYNDLLNKPVLNTGTVTTVSIVSSNGITGSVANPTTTPAITLALGNITPASVAATGTVSGSNLSGTNTGDQTITLTGDVSGSGTGSFATTLATVNSTTGVFGNNVSVPQITVDAKGRITNVVNVPISASGVGTVTSINVSGGTTGLTTSGGPVTSAGTITLSGTLSVANGGTGQTTETAAFNALAPDQTGNAGMYLTTDGTLVSWAPVPDGAVTLTGDVTGSGTGTFATTLATVNVTPGTYADAHFVPTITVNGKGLVTSITTQHVDESIRDLVEEPDTLVIAARHQYIVTGTLEVLGRIENNGRIAIL